MSALNDALAAALAGRGSLVLVGGEAGIGKSRLVAEVGARAEALGCLVVQGGCFEADRALPYAPLLDLMRSRFSFRSPEVIAAEVGLLAPELATLLPEFATLLPELIPAAPHDPDREKQRLFQALLGYFARLAATAPLCIVIEDLHWADDISLEFLLHLARRLAGRPLLLLLSYRTDEAPPGLRQLLAELGRRRLGRELSLLPLDLAEVEALLRAIVAPGRAIRAEFIEAVYALTEGNPFFVEEVLASLAAGGGRESSEPLRIPQTIRDAVARRVAWVSAPAQQVLTLAAVAGRRFDFSLLQELTGQGEAELVRQIKELVAAQLVVEESAERFAFRHALTRQAVYAQLLARERQGLHRSIVEALGRLGAGAAEATLPDLAYHCHAAGMWAESLRHARHLAERAQAMEAPQAAIEHFSRAIEATQRLGQPPSLALYRGRGQAYEVRGEFERALEDYERALGAARAEDDAAAEWQGLIDLGFLWAGRDYERSSDFFRRALALAERMGDPGRLARSLNRLGNWHVNMDQPAQGRDCHRRALAIFRDLGDQPGMAESLDLLAVASLVLGDRRGAIGYFEEAIALLRTLGERRGLSSTLATLAHLRCSTQVYDTLPGATGDPGQARGEAEEALAIARAIGWRSGEAYALCELSDCLMAAGDYGRALGATREGLAIAEVLEHREWMAIAHSNLGFIHLDLLAPTLACQHCERALTWARDMGAQHIIGLSAAFLASTHLLNQDPQRAETALADLVTPEAPLGTLTQAVLLATYGELCLARGEPDVALGIAERLIAWAEAVGGAGVVPRLWLLRGAALAALGRATEAEVTLREAQETARQQGIRPRLWQIHLALARLLRAQGRREETGREYAAIRAIAEEIAATIQDEALRDGYLASALAQVPTPRPPTSREAARAAYGGLTAREREVAALIARGRSNREIAEALFVSERTVEAHTGHIRDKLGFTARAQVAAWAVEQGLGRAGE
jgi:DNA-binding CsgD family transcriptional regulator